MQINGCLSCIGQFCLLTIPVDPSKTLLYRYLGTLETLILTESMIGRWLDIQTAKLPVLSNMKGRAGNRAATNSLLP